MEISPILLFRMLLISVLLGCVLGALRDLYYAFWLLLGIDVRKDLNDRKKGKSDGKIRWISWGIQFLGDLMFFVLAAFCSVSLNYTFNDGKLRIYTFFGLFFGFFVYLFSVEKWVFFLLERVIFVIRRIFLVCFGIVFFPFRKCVDFFSKKISKIRKKIKKSLAKKKGWVYNVYVKKYHSKMNQKKSFENGEQREKNRKEGGADDTEKVL